MTENVPSIAQAFVAAPKTVAGKYMGCAKLAARLDREVRVSKDIFPPVVIYHFSDASAAGTRGRGRSFRQWVVN